MLRAILKLNLLFSLAIFSDFSATQYWLSNFLVFFAFCENQVLLVASFSFRVGAWLVYLAQIAASLSIFETDLFAETPI